MSNNSFVCIRTVVAVSPVEDYTHVLTHTATSSSKGKVPSNISRQSAAQDVSHVAQAQFWTDHWPHSKTTDNNNRRAAESLPLPHLCFRKQWSWHLKWTITEGWYLCHTAAHHTPLFLSCNNKRGILVFMSTPTLTTSLPPPTTSVISVSEAISIQFQL